MFCKAEAVNGQVEVVIQRRCFSRAHFLKGGHALSVFIQSVPTPLAHDDLTRVLVCSSHNRENSAHTGNKDRSQSRLHFPNAVLNNCSSLLCSFDVRLIRKFVVNLKNMDKSVSTHEMANTKSIIASGCEWRI